jgi:hypothetical protein
MLFKELEPVINPLDKLKRCIPMKQPPFKLIEVLKIATKVSVITFAVISFSAVIASCTGRNLGSTSPSATSTQEHPEHPSNNDHPEHPSNSDHPEHPSNSDHPEHPSGGDHPEHPGR